MALDIEQALTTELAAVTGLTAKVFPLDAPQNETTPYVIYEASGREETPRLDGFDDLISTAFTIDVYHSTYANLKTLMKLVRAKLKSLNGATMATTGPYCQQIEFEDESEAFESMESVYGITMQITIHYKEV